LVDFFIEDSRSTWGNQLFSNHWFLNFETLKDIFVIFLFSNVLYTLLVD